MTPVDLPSFLLARYDEMERIARTVFHDLAYLLADIESKRRIVELHEPSPPTVAEWNWKYLRCSQCGRHWYAQTQDNRPVGVECGCPTLRLLAAPFSSHPDFQGAWRV